MNKFVCNYSLLRFRPYPETGEFVTVGVLTEIPQLNLLSYRLTVKKFGRITRFFPEIPEKLISHHVNLIEKNLKIYLRDEQTELFENIDTAIVFSELTRPREGLITFGEIGTTVTDEPENIAAYLYHEFVERQFARRGKHRISESINMFLKEWKIFDRYKRNQNVPCKRNTTVQIPFAEFSDSGKLITALFPFQFDNKRINDVEHTFDRFYGDLRRLSSAPKKPERIVLPYSLSDNELIKEHTLENLGNVEKQSGITTVDINNQERLKSILLV